MIDILIRLKSCNARGASHYSAFKDSRQAIGHTLLAFPAQ